MASDKTKIQGMLPSLTPRTCCLLSEAPWGVLDFIMPKHILDTNDDLTHKSGTTNWGWFTRDERSGIIYTCLGGFIDLGHLRDFVDLTRIYYYGLLKLPTKNGVITKGTLIPMYETHGGFDGVAVVQEDIPAGKDDIDSLISVARSLAYDVSIFYEISTYPVISIFKPGHHNSAFSPEDLVSNFLGTHIAANALIKMVKGEMKMKTNVFDDEVTRELLDVLEILKHNKSNVTKKAMDLITGRWIRNPSFAPGIDTLHLKRRNFSYKVIEPWVINGLENCGSPPFFFPEDDDIDRQIPDGIRSSYNALFNWRHEFFGDNPIDYSSSNFDALIDKVKLDAKDRYGPDFDIP